MNHCDHTWVLCDFYLSDLETPAFPLAKTWPRSKDDIHINVSTKRFARVTMLQKNNANERPRNVLLTREVCHRRGVPWVGGTSFWKIRSWTWTAPRWILLHCRWKYCRTAATSSVSNSRRRHFSITIIVALHWSRRTHSTPANGAQWRWGYLCIVSTCGRWHIL